MDTRDLQIFLQLSKSLHFARTSADAYISPSSLSRLVKRLEDETGARLFDRDNRTVKLTAAGELLQDYAQTSLRSWEDLCRRVQQQTNLLSGRLSVFCSVTASYYFLQELLDRFRASYPQVELQLHTGDSAIAVQRVQQEQEDLGIAARPDKLPAKLQFKGIGRSPLVFIAPTMACPLRERLLELRREAGGQAWTQLPMILSETGLARSRVNQWFRERDIKPEIYAQVTGNEAIVSMVSLGFGIGVVPRLVVESSPVRNKVEILSVSPGLEPFTIGLCVLKRKLSNPLIRAFWELATETQRST